MQTEELKKAAENGDAVAQYNLAVRLGEGTGRRKRCGSRGLLAGTGGAERAHFGAV